MSKQWWEPHPLDKYDQWKLLEIAESSNPPRTQPDDSDDWCGEVEFQAKDGWKVAFFYDCGELDYIDSFVTPDGLRLDVFADGYTGEHWPPVMCWQEAGDLERLRASTLQNTGRRVEKPKPENTMEHTYTSDVKKLIQFVKDQGFDIPELVQAAMRLEAAIIEGLEDYSFPVEE